MKRTTNFLPHSVLREDRSDGSILLRSGYDLGPVASRTGDWLHEWAEKAPNRVFLAERSGRGWREETYKSALEKVRALASSLLSRGMGADTPILILSGNGVDHGLLALAAQYIGTPSVPVAEQYSLIPGAQSRLVEAVELIKPKLVYTVDADQYSAALDLGALADVEIVASRVGSRPVTSFEALLQGDASVDVNRAHANVGPETIAKILMTSGSTSAPKGVLTTHGMLCVNQTQIADALPFLRERPPRIVDWLPWNHVFGGSHNFNMMLANGGSLYIDDGKPLKGMFERTLENLSLVTGTLMFNVPIGFALLRTALQGDDVLRQRFFEDLDLIFYAGASLPQNVWEAFEGMAMEVKGEVPLMTSSWGLTETAPAVLFQQEPTPTSGVVGTPMTGTTIKLIPDADMRCEIRVKGPNVMPGYFNAPEKTDEAFDDEGYFITGDAMTFVETADINKGLRFDGRISEEFKLLTGTWVRAANLRNDLLATLAPLAADVVITGHDRNEIGALLFPNRDALAEAGFADTAEDGILTCSRLQAELARRLRDRAQKHSSSSTRVARVLVLDEPPSLAEGEMTAKGNLNFRKVLTRRSDLLERLYNDQTVSVAKI